jgi:hypothetical protein
MVAKDGRWRDGVLVDQPKGSVMSERENKEKGLILKDGLDQTYCIPWEALEQFKVAPEELTDEQLDAVDGGVGLQQRLDNRGMAAPSGQIQGGLKETKLNRKFKIATLSGCTNRPCING